MSVIAFPPRHAHLSAANQTAIRRLQAHLGPDVTVWTGLIDDTDACVLWIRQTHGSGWPWNGLGRSGSLCGPTAMTIRTSSPAKRASGRGVSIRRARPRGAGVAAPVGCR